LRKSPYITITAVQGKKLSEMPAKLTAEIVNARLVDRGIALVGSFLGTVIKVAFRCQEGHEWEARPISVMNGTGCPRCASNTSLTAEDVNTRLAGRGLSLVGDLSGVLQKATFHCSKGHHWDAIPNNVMRGSGCPHCAGQAPLSVEAVNDRLSGRGIKLVGPYVNSTTRSIFRCDEDHEWIATPGSVYGAGNGCPTCAHSGFDPAAPAIFYYLQIDTVHDTNWKPGITNRTVEDRFRYTEDRAKITVLQIIHFERGADARTYEQSILKDHRAYRYKGPAILRGEGNSEILTRDVLGLAA
jgi:Zn finger protein HypA/HybF involved in hydrogenase expression